MLMAADGNFPRLPLEMALSTIWSRNVNGPAGREKLRLRTRDGAIVVNLRNNPDTDWMTERKPLV